MTDGRVLSLPPKGKQILGLSKGHHIFGTAKVGEKGQIVIPKEAREVFDIQPGDTLLILGHSDTGIVITKENVMHDVARKILDKVREDSDR